MCRKAKMPGRVVSQGQGEVLWQEEEKSVAPGNGSLTGERGCR